MTAPANSKRLDLVLVERGIARSRAVAAALIGGGKVTVSGHTITKASQLVNPRAEIEVDAEPVAASRAAHKLKGALDALSEFGPHLDGAKCLDIGASTGGFTQVLLEAGAAKVIALDVGHDQLIAELRANKKVIAIEGVNARYLTKDQLPFTPDIITADVSFISITMIIPILHEIASNNAAILLLIKPQFEVGKTLLGKGGIVRDPSQICAVIIEVIDSAIEHHLTPLAIIPSVLPGESGNREFFLYARFAPNRPQRSLNRGEMRHAAQAATKWEPDSGLPPVIMVPPVSTNS